MSGTAAVDGRPIRSLVVVAGPTAVGKSRFLQALADDGRLRERLGIPATARTATAGEYLQLGGPGPVDELILHYDILRPLHKGYGSHAADPGTAVLGAAAAISFFTLRTSPDRLAAQLDRRLASHDDPPKKLRRLRPLYDDECFVAWWYERWFAFVERFRAVTGGNFLVDTHRGYRLTPRP